MIISGKYGVLKAPDQSGNSQTLGQMTDWSVEVSQEISDMTPYRQKWRKVTYGTAQWSGSFSGMLSLDDAAQLGLLYNIWGTYFVDTEESPPVKVLPDADNNPQYLNGLWAEFHVGKVYTGSPLVPNSDDYYFCGYIFVKSMSFSGSTKKSFVEVEVEFDGDGELNVYKGGAAILTSHTP